MIQKDIKNMTTKTKNIWSGVQCPATFLFYKTASQKSWSLFNNIYDNVHFNTLGSSFDFRQISWISKWSIICISQCLPVYISVKLKQSSHIPLKQTICFRTFSLFRCCTFNEHSSYSVYTTDVKFHHDQHTQHLRTAIYDILHLTQNEPSIYHL
jgi:hypothetical protein